jgi:hypothetical protein
MFSKKNSRTVLAVATMMFSFLACKEGNGKRDIEAYYFPLKRLEGGLVYEYQPVENTLDPPVYWYYKSLKEGQRIFLIGMSYDSQFSPDQFVREERVENGMLLVDFLTYEKDTAEKKQPVQANIEAANVFPFEVKEPYGVLLSSLHWRPLGDTSTITLVRNRQFQGDTVVVFGGNTIPAVNFNTRELVDQEVEGHIELEFSGSETYAKDIGLVYFKKNIDGWLMQYRLAAIYSMEDFEIKFKTSLGNIH